MIKSCYEGKSRDCGPIIPVFKVAYTFKKSDILFFSSIELNDDVYRSWFGICAPSASLQCLLDRIKM